MCSCQRCYLRVSSFLPLATCLIREVLKKKIFELDKRCGVFVSFNERSYSTGLGECMTALVLTDRVRTCVGLFSSANTQHKDDTVCKLIHRSLLVCMTTCEMIIMEIMM